MCRAIWRIGGGGWGEKGHNGTCAGVLKANNDGKALREEGAVEEDNQEPFFTSAEGRMEARLEMFYSEGLELSVELAVGGWESRVGLPGAGGAGALALAPPIGRGPVSPPFADAHTPALEPDTLHARLRLSADHQKVRCGHLGSMGSTPGLYFDALWQVLGRGCFDAGRHYWEVDVREAAVGWWVGAAYGSLRRRGASAAARLGCNRQSWCLELYDLEYWAFHDGQRSRLRPRDDPDRLGVFLDYEVGVFTFYDVTGGMTHLHTFRAAFQELLYPALRLWEGVISISRLP
ncbi:LOW QUALITY PROTEIN: tripartite motif-containing protein 14-like [Eschrichtius robustus]